MLRIGVLGTGKIGQLRARSIRESSEARLAAVYDVSAEAARAAAANSGAVVARSLEEFLDTEMDAVIVSSPVHVHEEPCVAAFARGRHVLCEKPVANTIEATQRIVEAAQGANRVLAVGFNLRYY